MSVGLATIIREKSGPAFFMPLRLVFLEQVAADSQTGF